MNSDETKSKVALRDNLAIERTYLAKERTLLSYIRTGLALLGVGMFVYKYIDIDILYKIPVVVLFSVPGAYITFYGVYKVVLRRKQRKDFDRYKKEYEI